MTLTSDEGKIVNALSEALKSTPLLVPKGTVFFHGAPIPRINLSIDPPRLCGDNWFTDNFSIAYSYAYQDFDHPKKIPGAVFQAVLSNDLYLAQEIPRDPSTNEAEGAWAKALLKNKISHAPQGDERKYVRAVFNLRFGATHEVAGLLKGRERFILDCDTRMWDLSVVSHRMKEGDAPFIAEGLR